MTSVTCTCLARAHVGGIKKIRFENGGQFVPANQIITDFGGLLECGSGNTLYRLPQTTYERCSIPCFRFVARGCGIFTYKASA